MILPLLSTGLLAARLLAAPADPPGMTFDGLDLSNPEPAPAKAPAPTPPKAPEKPLQIQGVDLSKESAVDRQKLDDALAHFAAGAYSRAALEANEILGDAALAELHAEARYLLARALVQLQLPQSALSNLEELFKMGQGPYFEPGMELLFTMTRESGDGNEALLVERMAPWLGGELPEKSGSIARYRIAQYQFSRARALAETGAKKAAGQSLDAAQSLALQIPAGDPLHAKAQYLLATIQFDRAADADALESFKEVVRENNPRSNDAADPKLRTLALMQLARIHYGHQQNRFALFYYDKVPRGSEAWLDSLLEASWAHFRVGEYERALGNLITLSSPFFKEAYLPEALILKAIIYYENCRYREAREILTDFEKRYTPTRVALERLTQMDEGLWEALSTGPEHRFAPIAMTDPRVGELAHALEAIAREKTLLTERLPENFRSSPLARTLSEQLEQERATLSKKADRLAHDRLDRELTSLKDLLSQGLRIAFETTTQEKDVLESQLTGGGKKVALQQYDFSVAVPDDQLYWPFEGEYWRDELGTYEYTLTQGCKPASTAGR